MMSRAFTYKRGCDDGEYLRQINPAYQRRMKELRKEMQQAQGSSPE